jgi:hypothetical protein
VAGEKREGLYSFGQKDREVTERGMREVVVGSLWQLLCQVKRKLYWFWERKSKARGRRPVLIFGRDRENLGLYVPFF